MLSVLGIVIIGIGLLMLPHGGLMKTVRQFVADHDAHGQLLALRALPPSLPLACRQERPAPRDPWSAFANAVIEENAVGGRVVAAPLSGAAAYAAITVYECAVVRGCGPTFAFWD